MTLDSAISWISWLNWVLRCMGTALCGMCMGGMLGSNCISHSSPGNLPIPLKTLGYSSLMSSFDHREGCGLVAMLSSHDSLVSLVLILYRSVCCGVSSVLVYMDMFLGISFNLGCTEIRPMAHEANTLPSSQVM